MDDSWDVSLDFKGISAGPRGFQGISVGSGEFQRNFREFQRSQKCLWRSHWVQEDLRGASVGFEEFREVLRKFYEGFWRIHGA